MRQKQLARPRLVWQHYNFHRVISLSLSNVAWYLCPLSTWPVCILLSELTWAISTIDPKRRVQSFVLIDRLAGHRVTEFFPKMAQLLYFCWWAKCDGRFNRRSCAFLLSLEGSYVGESPSVWHPSWLSPPYNITNESDFRQYRARSCVIFN